MSIEIRNARSEDLDEIIKIEAASFSDPWTEYSFRTFINDVDLFFIMTDADKTVGYAVLGLASDDFAELYNIAIHPDHRKRGLSSVLMKRLTDEAIAHGRSKILLEVRASNAPAIALYEKFGFAADGVRKGYYSNPKEDGILMSLDLQ